MSILAALGGLAGIASAVSAAGQFVTDRRNLAQQQDVLEYQKGIQSQIFAREDSSIQRRVEDLKAAGLSPVLAAGQGARAGSPVSVTAPQKGTTGQAALGQVIPQLLGALGAKEQISRTKAESAYIKAQTERAKAETAKTLQTTTFESERIPLEIEQLYMRNDELRRTLESRVREIVNRGHLTFQQSELARHQARIGMVDAQWKAGLQHFLQTAAKNILPGGYVLTPEMMNYLLAAETLDIRRLEKKWFEANAVGKLAGNAASIFRSIR